MASSSLSAFAASFPLRAAKAWLRPRLLPFARAQSTLEHPPKPDARSGKNLFELAALLPGRGVGARFLRKSWARNGYEDTHWTIKRIKFEPDGRHGDAWGTLTWRGQEKKAMGRVRGALKREWRYEPVSDPAAAAP